MTAAPADVVVRTLDRIADLVAAEALFTATWPGQPPATAGLLKALEHAGGYVAGAYAGDEMVGAAAAFLASHPGPALHSHLAAVTPRYRGAGVGYALKTHQQAWAAKRGLTAVTWTFDPLVRRNAWFNLGKLGASIAEYLVDFYGRMDDGVNDGDESDRLLAVWPVTAAARPQHEWRVETTQEGRRRFYGWDGDGGWVETLVRVALDEVGGEPVPHLATATDDIVAVATPPDVEALRRSDPVLAHAWRIAVREALVPLLETHHVQGFSRSGSYVLIRRWAAR